MLYSCLLTLSSGEMINRTAVNTLMYRTYYKRLYLSADTMHLYICEC